jgi:hypothetical protein
MESRRWIRAVCATIFRGAGSMSPDASSRGMERSSRVRPRGRASRPLRPEPGRHPPRSRSSRCGPTYPTLASAAPRPGMGAARRGHIRSRTPAGPDDLAGPHPRRIMAPSLGPREGLERSRTGPDDDDGPNPRMEAGPEAGGLGGPTDRDGGPARVTRPPSLRDRPANSWASRPHPFQESPPDGSDPREAAGRLPARVS